MNSNSSDSLEYRQKKQQLARVLTIYGRKPVLEALQDKTLKPQKLHLADSNQESGIVAEILALARSCDIPVAYHQREALARISKNRKQDQGVALDIRCAGFQNLNEFSAAPPARFSLLAVDGVTNPQNLGMIIRSVCASPTTALIIPNKGCAKLDSLVIKASAGTLFKARILRCDSLPQGLQQLAELGSRVYALAANSNQSLMSFEFPERAVFVLGNETHGISRETQAQCTDSLSIPMWNGVESLNVSIAASLIAFAPCFRR